MNINFDLYNNVLFNTQTKISRYFKLDRSKFKLSVNAMEFVTIK